MLSKVTRPILIKVNYEQILHIALSFLFSFYYIFICYQKVDRSLSPEVLCKKATLEKSRNSYRKTRAMESF